MIRRTEHAVSGAFVFLLLGMFAVFAFVMVLFGAQAYKGTVEDTARHNEQRILQSFAVNAILADDAADAVSIEDGDVLTFTYDYDGEGYIKRIYCHDGALRELFTDAASDFDPEAGEFICAAESWTLTREGSLITAVITDQYGDSHTAHAALRCPQ